jgi:hypothetical protein
MLDWVFLFDRKGYFDWSESVIEIVAWNKYFNLIEWVRILLWNWYILGHMCFFSSILFIQNLNYINFWPKFFHFFFYSKHISLSLQTNERLFDKINTFSMALFAAFHLPTLPYKILFLIYFYQIWKQIKMVKYLIKQIFFDFYAMMMWISMLMMEFIWKLLSRSLKWIQTKFLFNKKKSLTLLVVQLFRRIRTHKFIILED